ncbi:MAG: ABC transporter permease [Candidatus Pacebacteria bacterium]|nr:ABC transporter permease [Candidatus Paceibacterota bacterium]
MKKIYYLWLRQIKKYWRSKPRLAGTLFQPVVFLLMFGYGMGSTFSQSGGNYLDFLVPGIIGMSIIFTAIFTGLEMIWDRQFGFLKETLVAPMPRFEVMLGRTLGGATVATIQGCLVLFIAMLFNFRPLSWLLVLPAIFVMFLIALVFSSIGTIIGSLLDDMQAFTLIINFLVQPLFFLSGALFPLQGLPVWLSSISRIDPLTYGINAMRVLLSDISYHDLGLMSSVIILILMAFILLLVGGYCFDRIQA